MLRNCDILEKGDKISVTIHDVKNNLMHFLGFLIILYIAYYINGLQDQNAEFNQIIKSQNELINVQKEYIKEVNNLLGFNPQESYLERKNSPINRGPI